MVKMSAENKKMEVRLKIADSLHARLKAAANAKDISITAQTKLYIAEGLQKDERAQGGNKEVS